MPTNHQSPSSNESIDRLNLSADSPRGGGHSSGLCACCGCTCFDVDASAIFGTQNVGLCAITE